jgi:hypothetical protein
MKKPERKAFFASKEEQSGGTTVKFNYEEMYRALFRYVYLRYRYKKENLTEECHWWIRKESSDHL